MDWFKSLFDKFAGTTEEVHIVSTGRKYEPEIKEEPLFQFTPSVKMSFESFLEKGDISSDILMFDPEEKNVYSYRLTEEKAEVLQAIPIDEWKEMLSTLKTMNRKKVDISDESYLLFLSISFTDLGERISIIIFKSLEFDDAKLNKQKLAAVKRIRDLKPPTALNRGHIENIYKMLETAPQKDSKELFQIIEELDFIPSEKLEKLKHNCDVQETIAYPVPRKLMTRALAKWLGFEYFDVELTDIDEKIAKRLPEEVAKPIRAVPVAEREGKIMVAFWNPFDTESIRKVKEHLGDNIVPVMGCEEEIRSKVRGIHKK